MSDRIAVMDEGRIGQIGSPEDIYERPATTFVAGFIGVSNLMPGSVRSIDGDFALVRLDAGVQVAAPSNGLRSGEACHAVVRPEKLRVSSTDEALPPGSPSVEGVVESSLYLGTSTQLVVRLPDQVAMTVLVPNADEAERQRLPGAGVAVRLSWAPEHMHLVHESGAEPATSGSASTGDEPLQATATGQGGERDARQ